MNMHSNSLQLVGNVVSLYLPYLLLAALYSDNNRVSVISK